jgi:hypothetical protein
MPWKWNPYVILQLFLLMVSGMEKRIKAYIISTKNDEPPTVFKNPPDLL